MKTKLLNFKALAVMMACLTCALTASAYDMVVNGIYYTKLTNNTVEVSYANINSADYSGNITIPGQVSVGTQSWTVRGIGYKAFGECTNLTSVTLPGTLTYVGELAFIRCTSLSTIDIPEGVTWIGSNAFEQCSSMTVVHLPTTLESIGNIVFNNCSSLGYIYCEAYEPPTLGTNAFSTQVYSNTYLVLNNAVIKERYKAAEGWSNFSHINALSYYSFEDNGIYYAETSATTVAVCAKDENYNSYSSTVNVPSTAVNVSRAYFVNEVGANAFRNCDRLFHCYLPYTVKKIGDFAFANCNNLMEFPTPENSLLTEIGNNAFVNVYFASVTFPESLTKIGNYAFSGCKDLARIVIPDNVTTIGASAFWNCTGLKYVTIGAGCETIGGMAFQECTSLLNVTSLAITPPPISYYTFRNNSGWTTASLTVPYSAKSAYENADYWRQFSPIETMYDFEYNGIYYNITGNGTADVTYKNTSYNTYSGTVYVPSYVSYNSKTYYVRGIGDHAFYQCTNLTSVTLTSYVNKIGPNAFNRCTNLTRITIPNNVTIIDQAAFGNCSSLQTVTFGTKVQEIGINAFINCSALQSLDLPASLSTIKMQAFYNCTALTSVTNRANTPPTVQAEIFSNSVYSGATLYVPSRNAVERYDSAPYWTKFQTILPLQNYDFEVDGIYYNITGDNTVCVTYNNKKAGTDYTGDVVIPSSVTYNGTTYTVTSIDECAFYRCPVTSVTMPNTITTMGMMAFENCSSLTQVTLSENLTEIPGWAFMDCHALQSIVIPASVNKIQGGAFSGCTSLNIITCMGSTPPTIYSGTFDTSHYTSVTVYVPDYQAQAAYQTAQYWSNFHYITSMKDYDFEVDGIYYRIFNSNVSVVRRDNQANTYSGDLVIPETVTYNGTTYTVTEIFSNAFTGCPNLTSLTIPATVTNVEYAFFYNRATNLTSITCLAINPPVGMIDMTTDQYANVTVNVPKNSVAAYQADEGWGQFANINALAYDFKRGSLFYEITGEGQAMVTRENSSSYTGMTQVSIPSIVTLAGTTYSITAINTNTFRGCSNLTSVSLPSSVKKINNYAFYQCTSLTTVNFGNVDSIGSYSFAYCTSLASVVLNGYLKKIQGTSFAYCTSLKNYQRYAVEDSPAVTYEFVNGVIFTKKAALKTLVTYPYGKIGTSYTVPNGTVMIGDYAFLGNAIVINVNMPESLKKILTHAFDGCTKITSIEVPKGVTEIGTYAFNGCTSLQSALLPSTLTSLGGAAFHNDAALTSVNVKATTPPTCGTVVERPNTIRAFDASHYTTVVLGVPTGYKAAYQAANTWKNFTHINEYDYLLENDIMLGDVTGDGQLNVSDVTALIAHILGNTPATFVLEAANVNGDDSINVADVTMLISMILNNK